MRQPRIGEMLKCHACMKDWKHADQEWIEYFNRLDEKEQAALYNEESDVFLGYDGCEGDEEEREETGLREDQRSYIRGTSYRPW